MKEPKFKIGDKVWFMRDNRIVCAKILAIVELETHYLYGRSEYGEETSASLFWGKLKNKLLSLSGFSSSPTELKLYSGEELYFTKQDLINFLSL